MDAVAPSGPSRGTTASRGRRKARRRSTARGAASAAYGRIRRSLPLGTGGPADMAGEDGVVELVYENLEWPEGVPCVVGDDYVYQETCGQPLEADLPLSLAEHVGCATASNLFGGMPEQREGPTVDQLEEPVDISVDVIHVFARNQLGGSGINFNGMGLADVILPEDAGRGDGLGDTDDLVQAYTEGRFRDDDEDTIDCFPRLALYVVSLVILLMALLIFCIIIFIRSYF